ncbi:TadE/TadG family type IV pilus assembly protein [Pseudonocardia lacus]|uniref:TadE/TadG family type IV pilus assembly protein n=1 Tax=Pseudonocardia lacus TaxID=2835865 RepID=UPI0027E2FFE3|nr:TadE/TadG family type IV pilus assembly protein [Pseudonocardia lacus]
MPGQDASERGGAASVEAAILAIAVGLLIALAIAGGRLVSAESAADHAARAAARVASLQRDPATAQHLAVDAARRSLAEQGLACDALTVVVDTSEFGRPLGAPGVARASVTCAVRWSDLGLPVVAGSREIAAEFVSPLDQLRERA